MTKDSGHNVLILYLGNFPLQSMTKTLLHVHRVENNHNHMDTNSLQAIKMELERKTWSKEKMHLQVL